LIGHRGDQTRSNSDDTTSLSSQDSSGFFHEAKFCFTSIVERLDSMYKLAAKIRNPANRPQRPTKDLYKHISESERAEYKRNQEQIEIERIAFVQKQHLRESVTEAQLQVLALSQNDLLTQYASATHWLVLRIGMANARRRQQFVYWGTHAELLARDTTVEVPIVREETTTVVPAPGPTEKPIQSVATSVTKFVAANLIGGDDLRSVISHNSRVSTVLSPQGEKLAWPQAPHRLSGSKFFSCPYCKVLCPAAYLSQDKWRYVADLYVKQSIDRKSLTT
jgi:hypothetical protein